MSEANLLPVLYTRLAVCACDPSRMAELARWYEEQGEAGAAACVRWVIEKGRQPFCYTRQAPLAQHSDVWHPGWYWWATDLPAPGQGGWGHPSSCRLPHELWRRLRHSLPYEPVVFKEYATLQLAFEALIGAWAEWAAPREAPPVPEAAPGDQRFSS
jgi:hypothetical protein